MKLVKIVQARKMLFASLGILFTAAALLLIFSLFQTDPRYAAKKAQLGFHYAAAEKKHRLEQGKLAGDKRLLTEIETKIKPLSLSQKAGRLFMIAIPGSAVSQESIEFINRFKIGGVIIMGGNVVNRRQLRDFVQDLRNKVKHNLLIAVDQEGGTVARIFWEPHATASAAVLGATSEWGQTQEVSSQRAKALKELDIDINLAPVADLNFPGSWIGNRSFGQDPSRVVNHLTAVIRGQQQQGILSTVKHFPGIGRASSDSHAELPVILASKDLLLNIDLQPFKLSIDQGVELVMTGHVLYPNLDEKRPATLSKYISTELLRKSYGFTGLVITDDMKMGALQNYSNKNAKALKAGANILLLIDSFGEIEEAIGEVSKNVPQEILDQRLRKLLLFQEKAAMP